MHLLSLVSSLLAGQKSVPVDAGEQRASKQKAACRAELDDAAADVKRRLAEMGLKLHIAPLAVRRDRARLMLRDVWESRLIRGECSFDTFMKECGL